jgi:CheY-like chemotaxis protein
MARTVLVADDSPIIRKMLCQIFEEEDDYDLCAEATNGQEAIDLAIKHRPDLIILDLSMPLMNGLTAAQQLKKIMPTVPIILFTHYAELAHFRYPTGASADRVVSKDNASQLLHHIQRTHSGLSARLVAIDRNQPEASGIASLGRSHSTSC